MTEARRACLILAPAVLLVAHGLAVGWPHELVFGLDATRAWSWPLRWAWLGLGLAAAASGTVRTVMPASSAACRQGSTLP